MTETPTDREQMREFTRAWPAMRRALARLSSRLMERGYLRQPDDIYYLRRAELNDALAGRLAEGPVSAVEARRAHVQTAARLTCRRSSP